MIGSFAPFDNRDHRWVRALKQFGVRKVGIHDQYTSKVDFMSGLITKLKRPNPYFKNSLVTYMGFGFNPSGVLFRSMDDKLFIMDDFIDRDLRFYVSQKFEENITKYKYGTPIALLEGVLDVESFCYLTGYPFAIGYLTSHVRPILASFLASFTNRFLVVPDNDQKKDTPIQLKKTIVNFSKVNVVPRICNTQVKDFGDVFEYNVRHDIDVARCSLKELF